ncbi:MAG TPA: isochorismatase family cysteine hydrolase [Polyangia bacterium]|nr:isochorismatase family cysteine hydrolase [Polyangia bacterium]
MIAIEPKRTALLAMDFQTEIVARLGQTAAAAVERAAALIAAARRAGVEVIHVVVGFRPGYPEVSPRNVAFSTIAGTGRFVTGVSGAEIAPPMRPADGEVVVVKHRVSAFAGTDLEMILRAKGIDTLILTGLATSGVVLSTVRAAADSDHRLFVVKDACADADDEVHRVLTEKLFPRQAAVLAAAELAPALGG